MRAGPLEGERPGNTKLSSSRAPVNPGAGAAGQEPGIHRQGASAAVSSWFSPQHSRLGLAAQPPLPREEAFSPAPLTNAALQASSRNPGPRLPLVRASRPCSHHACKENGRKHTGRAAGGCSKSWPRSEDRQKRFGCEPSQLSQPGGGRSVSIHLAVGTGRQGGQWGRGPRMPPVS